MQGLVYILVYPIIWCLSKLPFWVLYRISDVLFFFVYHIFGYRRKVVRDNLALVFPEKSVNERKAISKEFYVHLCDMVVEAIKSLSISKQEMLKRFKVTNVETVLALEKEGRSIMMFMGHYASWEWSVILQHYVNHKGYAVYKKIENPYFDRLVKKIRARYGSELINTKETVHRLGAALKNNELLLTAFSADQTAKHWKAKHFNEFMGIKVPVLTGGEMMAKKFNLAVIYLDIRKVKRGHYSAEIRLITKNPNEFPDFEITDQFLTMVENQIKAEPAYYLWTHKRWKYRNEVQQYENR
ncbi:MAG: lysophospholipid acyltransferase family protein [Marinirhabdus sp.]|nr:lysophospholipid acyltransferase family protein [Marinirhabdus sp.]